MTFVPLTTELLPAVEPWFDDGRTRTYLGDRAWVRRALDLVRSAPGCEFRGRIVRARHVWVVLERADHAVALVDVERYDDGGAGFAFVVAPSARGRGIGRRVLRALDGLPELTGVERLIGAVEPENASALAAVRAAGFAVADAPDHEGMLGIERWVRRAPQHPV